MRGATAYATKATPTAARRAPLTNLGTKYATTHQP